MPTLYLVGAGPGDPELITLKAIHTLDKADVVLYDALVNPVLLDHCNPDSIKVFVGKRKGAHSMTQDEINLEVLKYLNVYEHVVRLKGGDPFVFGRASEEIDFAQEKGFNVVSIPGVSSAIAVPEIMLIPLTSRGTNESFWVTTGTTKIGRVSQDMNLAAQSSATVIILMAMSNLEEITRIFTKHRGVNTPVAIIQDGTTPDMKMIVSSLDTIYEKAKRYKITNPSIIVIGKVVDRHFKYSEMGDAELRKAIETALGL